ncbi:hypothetical protein [Rhizobium mongolense]|nr:hypothetical protein [Rhizobium mongolense]MBB4231524.1 hypothetical protein [Rhizobium mongolense]
MAKVAKEFGVVVEYVDGDVTVRICPNHQENSEAHLNPIHRISDRPREPVDPPFDWREHQTMQHLATLGAEVRTCWRTLKNFGPSTQKKLEHRGYIAVSYETDKPNVVDEVWLTKNGMKAWKSLSSYYDKYPSL